MRIIAIEREFGSGGREIGLKVANKAEIPFYDGELMVKAANDFHISLDLLKEFDEKKTGSILYDLATLLDYNQSGVQKIHELFYGMQETIKKLALQGSAIFIGRCSTDILKYNDEVIRVFIYSSDLDKRIQRVVETEGMSNHEAEKLIEKKDKQRKDYYKFWTKKDWSDMKNYDIELNTGKLSIEDCVDVLFNILNK